GRLRARAKVPGRAWAKTPPWPDRSASTSGESGTIVMTASASATASATVSAPVPPSAIRASTLPRLRLWPTTVYPARTRLRAMGRPMMPRPMKAIFCRAMVFPLVAVVAVVVCGRVGAAVSAHPAEAFGAGHGGFVLEPDEAVVAAVPAVGQEALQGEFTTTGFAAAGGVGDLDVAELGRVVAHELRDVVAVDGQVEEVGEEGDVLGSGLAGLLDEGEPVGGGLERVVVGPADGFDEHGAVDTGDGLGGGECVLEGDAVLLLGGGAVLAAAVEGVETGGPGALGDLYDEVDVGPELGGAVGVAEDAAVRPGELSGEEVEPGQTHAGGVDGGDEGVDLRL